VTDSKVLKISTFLQSLDTDNSTNEIEITEEQFDKFNSYTGKLTDDSFNVAKTLTEQSVPVKDENKVKAHLLDSQKEHQVVTDKEVPTATINDLTDAPIDGSIIVTFSETINVKTLKTAGNVVLKDAAKNVIEGNGVYSFDNKTFTFTPTNNLKNDTRYTFTISKNVTDLAGNKFAADIETTFTTVSAVVVDTTKPIVASIVPADSGTDVGIDSNIVITFSENLAVATVTADTIILKKSGTAVTPKPVVTYTNKVVTINPTNDLENGVTYTVEITDTVTDTAGNTIVPVSKTFTTEPPAGISFKGKTYQEVTSPHTSKIWLDRNLGADQVCSSSNDENCFGGYYQWGRKTNGHEVKDSATSSSTISENDVETGGVFIDDGGWMWTNGTTNLWTPSSTPYNNPCPSSFRVPTKTELENETLNAGVTDKNSAFSSFLKIPTNGYREITTNGGITQTGNHVHMWTADATNGGFPTYLKITTTAKFTTDDEYSGYGENAIGKAVRCIKN
ncbi:MAG: Ig-like domain-containing protein, partial [Campylobacterales bacterium]|nr:Ig-like domain-containing protein [Campylobacterales bacterium]